MEGIEEEQQEQQQQQIGAPPPQNQQNQQIPPPENNVGQNQQDQQQQGMAKRSILERRAQPQEKDANVVVGVMYSTLNVATENPLARDFFFIDSRQVQIGNVMAIAQGTWDDLEVDVVARCFMIYPCLKFEDLDNSEIFSVNVGEHCPHILVLSVSGFRNLKEVIEGSKVQGEMIPVKHHLEASLPPFSSVSGFSTSQKTGAKAMEDLFRQQGLFGQHSGGSHGLKNAGRLQDMVVMLKINGGDQSKLVLAVTPSCDIKVDGPRNSFVRRAVEQCMKYYSEFSATFNVANFAKTICGFIGAAASDVHIADFAKADSAGASPPLETFDQLLQRFDNFLQVMKMVWVDDSNLLVEGFLPLGKGLHDTGPTSFRNMAQSSPRGLKWIVNRVDRIVGEVCTGLRNSATPFDRPSVVHQMLVDGAFNMQLIASEWSVEMLSKQGGPDPSQAATQLANPGNKKRKRGQISQAGGAATAVAPAAAAAKTGGGGGGGGRGGGNGRGSGGRGGGGGGGVPPGAATSTQGLCVGHLAHLLLPTVCGPCAKAACNFDHKALPGQATKADKDAWTALITRVIRNPKRQQDLLTQVAALP